MKTYAEERGKKPMNWNKVLETPMTEENDWYQLYELSCDWATCAVGNQCVIIPRDKIGIPFDLELHMFGKFFTTYMGELSKWSSYSGDFNYKLNKFTMYIARAKEMLHNVELRSQELIQELK